MLAFKVATTQHWTPGNAKVQTPGDATGQYRDNSADGFLGRTTSDLISDYKNRDGRFLRTYLRELISDRGQARWAHVERLLSVVKA